MQLKENKNIVCTVSAGYSSAIMAIKIKEWYPNHNIIYVFANTSKEHIESLNFIKKLDKKYSLNIVCLEAKINKNKGKGTTFNIVNIDELSSNGFVFEKGIAKYGVPSVANKWCTRELKNNPIKKYADVIFGLNNYSIALGIRYDEIDRISKNFKTNNVFYPLFEKEITTKERNRFFALNDLKINIPAYKGNCDMCFEKSARKRLTYYEEDNSVLDWWFKMEDNYSSLLIDGKSQYNELILKDGGSYFNRGNQSLKEFVKLLEKPFTRATDEYIYEDDLFDLEGDCGSVCVLFND